MRNHLLFPAVLLIAGCLSTKTPVFDETNSLPVAEIPEFMTFVDTWEAYIGPDGSPRELIAEGVRGTVVDGIVVVQEHSDYFALAVIGDRPLTCAIYADKSIEDVAKGHGVTLEIERPENGSFDDFPVPVTADGPREALVSFIRDQFANQRLACLANPRRHE